MIAGSAFFLFHLRVGVRVSLRVIAPLVAGFFFCLYILKYEFFLRLAEILFKETDPLAAGLIIFLVSLVIARAAAPRVLAGVRGWIRHLPASGSLHRRLAAASILLAQTPVLAILLFFGRAVLRPLSFGDDVRLAGVVLAAGAASWAALPLRNPFLIKRTGRRRFRHCFQGFAFQTAHFLRVLKLGLIAGYLPALISLGAAALFIANNPLGSDSASRAAIFGAVLAQGLFMAEITRRLLLKSPPWAWARSLPRSSRKRVLTDAGLFALFASLLLPLSARAGFGVLLTAACCLPWLCFRAVAGLRTASANRWSVRARSGTESLLTALALALEPRAVYLLLGAAPFAYLFAAAKDREQKVSLWNELHQLADGDTPSGSES